MDYSRWMSLETRIHGKKLANICLPMTHDSGTFDLSDILAPDPSFLPGLEEKVAKLVKLIEDAGIPLGMDPLAWLMKEALPALKGLTTATKKTVGEQLQGGMRGFDFRMYNKDGVDYIYHGLQSTSTFRSMLDDIHGFLKSTTRKGEAVGEIVYVNMSHYLDYSDVDLKAFGELVKSRIGEWAYLNDGTNDPFTKTYKEIIGQGGEYKSRVILVTETDLGDTTYFWPRPYCPPDEGRDMSVLYGKYTDSTNLSKVIDTQVSQFQTALARSLPFVNYMTMTPGPVEYFNIIGSSLYGAFTALAADLALIGQEEAAAAALVIAATLFVDDEATRFLGWRTLEELESQIDSQLPELVDDNFLPYGGTTNQISMIFCDFWENSQVVDLAIALSDDFQMEWSGNNVITCSGVQLASDEGPTAAMYKGQLHMLYKDKSKSDMWMAIYDPPTDTWISNQRVADMRGGAALGAATDKSPAAAIFNEQLYVVWKSSSGNAIRCAYWNGLSWGGGAAITIPAPGQNPVTDNSPYLAHYKGTLHLVYKYNGSNDIHWATLSSKNFTWSGGAKIEVADNSKEKVPGTNVRPALVEYGGILYMLYKGDSSNLWQSTFNGTWWSGNNKIKNDDADYDPKSVQGPGLSRFAGDIYMAYRDTETNDMRLSFNDGISWNGNILMRKHTPVAPETKRGPFLVRAGVKLFLLNQGNREKLYQSVLKPAAL